VGTRSGELLAPLERGHVPLAKSIKRADTIWIEPRYEADMAHRDYQTDWCGIDSVAV
jgi:hypothetical protein